MRRPGQQRKLPHTPLTPPPRPADGVPEWPTGGGFAVTVRNALFALRTRHHAASFTRAGVTPLERARAIVAHDRILTGDPRNA